MDPNETLRDIRELVTAWREADLHSTEREVAEDLVTRVESLDAWLTSGGFMPEGWARRDVIISVPKTGTRYSALSPSEAYVITSDLLENYEPDEIEWEA